MRKFRRKPKDSENSRILALKHMQIQWTVLEGYSEDYWYYEGIIDAAQGAEPLASWNRACKIGRHNHNQTICVRRG